MIYVIYNMFLLTNTQYHYTKNIKKLNVETRTCSADVKSEKELREERVEKNNRVF